MAENESLNDLGLARVCRSCLADEGEMKSLFSVISDNPDVEVFRIFECCTGLEISQGDGLPAVICLQCDLRLTNAYEFRKLSQKSEKIMRQYIGNVAKYSSKEDHPIEATYVVETLDTDDVKDESADVVEEEREPGEIDLDNKSDDHKSDIEMEQNSVCDNDNDNSLDSDDKPLLIRQDKTKLIQYDDEVIKDVIMSSKRQFGVKRECRLCGFVASNSRGLTVHISHLHKELKDRWCNVCYEEVDNLIEHLQTHNIIRSHTCALCDRKFSCQSHLIEHIKGHSVNRPYKCNECEKGFISQRHLKVHSRIHAKVKPYNCPHCKRGFTQKVSLKGHLRIHTGCKPYRCECNKKFTTSGALATHRKTTGHLEYVKIQIEEQEPIMEFVPPVDDNSIVEVIKNETDLTDSETVGISSSVSTKARKLCTVCGKTFSNSSKLRLHMRVHTGETPYKCQYCPKQFTTRGQLVVHVRTHTGEKPHVCHVCGKGFAQSSVLNTHMRLHTGRPVECKVCQQRFCRPAELKLHMRKHTGEKPYLCTECGHSFIQRSHLMEHIKTHSDERPYKCHVCDRAFKQSSSLKSHIQIHTGYKPFKCSQCPYACRQSYSLTQHMKQHSVDQPEPTKPHVCLVCNKSFTTLAMLTSHSRTVHQAIF